MLCYDGFLHQMTPAKVKCPGGLAGRPGVTGNRSVPRCCAHGGWQSSGGRFCCPSRTLPACEPECLQERLNFMKLRPFSCFQLGMELPYSSQRSCSVQPRCLWPLLLGESRRSGTARPGGSIGFSSADVQSSGCLSRGIPAEWIG